MIFRQRPNNVQEDLPIMSNISVMSVTVVEHPGQDITMQLILFNSNMTCKGRKRYDLYNSCSYYLAGIRNARVDDLIKLNH